MLLSFTPSGEAKLWFGIGALWSRTRCHQGTQTLLAFFAVRPISQLNNLVKGGIWSWQKVR